MIRTIRISCLTLLLVGITLSTSSGATSTWNNGAMDSNWTSPGNWVGNSVPSTSAPYSDVIIGSDPSSNLIGIDENNSLQIINSLTFASTLNQSNQIVPANSETLQVNGNITNSSTHSQSLELGVYAGANATYSGGSGGISFNTLDVGLYSVQSSGITVSTQLNFQISSASSFGHIGSVNLANTGIIDFDSSTYTGNLGDSFQIVTGTLTGASASSLNFSSLPSLSSGLRWDTSLFLTSGIISVAAVPEPSTYCFMGVGIFALLGFGSIQRARRVRA